MSDRVITQQPQSTHDTAHTIPSAVRAVESELEAARDARLVGDKRGMRYHLFVAAVYERQS
jgi:hypothetical protein